MSVLALCVFLVVLVAAGLALPVPPSLVAVRIQELSFGEKEDTRPQSVEGSVFEYYKDGSVSPSLCEEYCALTYPTHTYPTVENHLACRQGCILAQLGIPLDTCKLECSTIYSGEAERYACNVGCANTPSPQTEDGQVLKTLVAVSSVKTTSFGLSLFDIKESLKGYLWGSSQEAADSSFHWERPQHFTLGDGQELLFLSGHSEGDLSMKDILPTAIPNALLQDHHFSHPSLVYAFKSILHTVHHRTLLSKVLFSVGIVLLFVAVPMIFLSIIMDLMSYKKESQTDSFNENEEEGTKTFKTPLSQHMYILPEQTDIGSELPLKKESSLLPVTVFLHSKH